MNTPLLKFFVCYRKHMLFVHSGGDDGDIQRKQQTP